MRAEGGGRSRGTGVSESQRASREVQRKGPRGNYISLAGPLTLTGLGLMLLTSVGHIHWAGTELRIAGDYIDGPIRC